MNEKKIKLTARQIEYLDEINADSAANRRMLDVAMNSYRNRENQLLKEREKFWKEMHEMMGTTDETHILETKSIDNACFVVINKEKNNDDF